MASRIVLEPSARANANGRPYKPPTLTIYGQLRDITTGGSGAKSEPNPPKGNSKQRA